MRNYDKLYLTRKNGLQKIHSVMCLPKIDILYLTDDFNSCSFRL